MICFGAINHATDQAQRIKYFCWAYILVIAAVNSLLLLPIYLHAKKMSKEESWDGRDEERLESEGDSQETIEVVMHQDE